MKSKHITILCVICLLAPSGSSPSAAQSKKPKSENFSALAYLPTGAGPRMVGAGATRNVQIYIKTYSSDADTARYAGTLLDAGPDALLKELQKAKSVGKVSLQGRVGFFDLKLIRSRPTQGGRLITAVTDRPIPFLEAFYSGRSEDYKFGILQLELNDEEGHHEKGEGALVYAAKIKVLDKNKVEVENYGAEPVKLMGVRKF